MFFKNIWRKIVGNVFPPSKVFQTLILACKISSRCHAAASIDGLINPLASGLTTLNITDQIHWYLRNIWRGIDKPNWNNNFQPNISQNIALFSRYFHKYQTMHSYVHTPDAAVGLTHSCLQCQKMPTQLSVYLMTRWLFVKYLKEKCYFRTNSTIFLQIFCKFVLNFQVIPKRIWNPDDTDQEDLRAWTG